MKRYLLFNPGCALCTQLAQAVEQEAQGWLSGRSLHDRQMQALLKQARPNARWEPTLLEVDGERVQAFTGLRLELQLALGLGPRRCWRILRLIEQATPPRGATESARRTFLKGAAGAVGGIALGGIPLARVDALAKPASEVLATNRTQDIQLLELKKADQWAKKLERSAAYQEFHNRIGRDATSGAAIGFVVGDNVFIAIPFTYKGDAQGAALTAIVDRQGRGRTTRNPNTIGWSISSDGDQKHIQAWQDGAAITNFRCDADGNISQGWLLQDGSRVDLVGQNFTADGRNVGAAFIDRLRQPQRGNGTNSQGLVAPLQSAVNCFTNCLQNAGIPPALAALIGIICTAACIGFPVGALVCAGCLGAAGGGYASLIGICLLNC